MASKTHAKILLIHLSDTTLYYLSRSVVCDNGTGQWALWGDCVVISNLLGS